LAPFRVLDTRDGTGGRNTPVGSQESWKFPLAGRFGIPADAVAVALNLTAAGASAPTYVTVHPFAETRPLSSNLNPMPGQVTPNLVVARVGVDGAVVLYNNSGTVDLIADVVGYFAPASTVGLVALDPFRLLDTRDGTGDRLGSLGEGESIDVQVSGRGGVPDGVQAVMLNVTATEPTAASYLTLWPTGDGRPLASSVTSVAVEAVPEVPATAPLSAREGLG
jgi:hypothetical protein